MSAIVTIKSKQWAIIKGDSLTVFSMQADESSPNKVTRWTFQSKLFRVAQAAVAGLSFSGLPIEQIATVTELLRDYFLAAKPQGLRAIANKVGQYMQSTCKANAAASIDVLLVGYDEMDKEMQAYKLLVNASKYRVRKMHNNYASAGAAVVVNDLLEPTQLFKDIQSNRIAPDVASSAIDTILCDVSHAEDSYMKADIKINWHVGGDITGWLLTLYDAIELPIDPTKSLPTLVHKDDELPQLLPSSS